MWYHLFYINLIKFTITIDKLMEIYNYYGINDLLTEDAWMNLRFDTKSDLFDIRKLLNKILFYHDIKQVLKEHAQWVE